MATESQRDREVRAARNQSLFRAVNEKLRELNQGFSDVTETYVIACECADTTCVETLHIVMAEYVEVREHSNRFVVLAGHVFRDVERVVARNDGYAIVENNASVSEITEATDPSRE
jgi:hypothetical protein